MAKWFWKLARFLLGVGFVIIGGQNVPEPSSSLEQRWREVIPSWLEANWIALACFVLASVLILYQPFRWWVDRQLTKEARLRIRANLEPNSFDQTDGEEALQYLLRKSSWGWKRYARLNDWSYVWGRHFREFESAARDGKILTTGWDSAENKPVVIDGRFWSDGRIEEATATKPQHVTMATGSRLNRRTFSQLRVSTADMVWMWPEASLLRKALTHAWIFIKRKFWYGSPLCTRLEERRRRSKPDRAFS